MSKFVYLFAGFTAVWLGVLAYLLRLGAMRRALESRLNSLESAVGKSEWEE